MALYRTETQRLLALSRAEKRQEEEQAKLRRRGAELRLKTQLARQEEEDRRISPLQLPPGGDSIESRIARARAGGAGFFESGAGVQGIGPSAEPLPPEQAVEIQRALSAYPDTALERFGKNIAAPAVTASTTSVLPRGLRETIREQPIIGEPFQRVVEPATSPLGILTGLVSPQGLVGGTAGGVAGSIAGQQLEEAGFDPRLQTPLGPIGPRGALELGGAIAGVPLEEIAQRRLRQGLRAEISRAGGVRPLLSEETGAIKLPPREPPEAPHVRPPLA